MERYHFIGIGGIGMSALAHLLLAKQQPVSGSDLAHNQRIAGLQERGAKVVQGHHASHIEAGQTVVYTSDISFDNPEYIQAKALQCPLWHRSELLAHLVKGSQQIAVSGSHGKTTTTALMAHVLTSAGWDPSFVVGGMFEGANGYLGKGQHFVFEADESDGSWLNYFPDYAIITNLNREHMKHYGNMEGLQESCKQFCSQVQKQVVYCADESNLNSLNIKGIRYGFHPDSDVCILQTEQNGFTQKVTIRDRTQAVHSFHLSLAGKHNALNSAAVFTLAQHLGVPVDHICKAMGTFSGVNRRMEYKGSQNGILRLDDYAHHPVEIKTTLEGCKKAISERRLVVLFQPQRFTRTRDQFHEFVHAFDWADHLFITDIYSAGEPPIEGITAQNLVALIQNQKNVPCQYLPRADWGDLNQFLQPHDVFISMGAGDVPRVHEQINNTKKLKIGLIYGGKSCEHEVSCRSAEFVRESLSADLYEQTVFFIDKQGQWHLEGTEASGSFLTPAIGQALEKCDLFFPVLHGSFGEDGTIQGLFEMLDKPYVGCDWTAAAIAMNKMQSKQLAAAAGVNTPKAVSWTQREWSLKKNHWLEQAAQLQFPVFVKPNHLGSSVGVSKVESKELLEAAVEKVFQVDVQVLVEEGVEHARECEFAIVGNRNGFGYAVPNPGERLSEGKLITYDMKYSSTSSNPMVISVDANFDPEVLQQGRQAAEKVYQVIGCSGMTRVDFLLDPSGTWWFFELNAIPGMTSLSSFPKIWNREGITPGALMDRLVILALDRAAARKRYFKPCVI